MWINQIDIDKFKNVLNSLSSLKSKEDKSDIGKLETTPFDLIMIYNVVKNNVVTKTEYNAKIKNIEDKLSDITNLATKITVNAKIHEDKGEIPNIRNLASNTVLTAVETKIPNVSNLV